MSPTLVAIDVGASRTRVRVGAAPSEFHSRGGPLIREIGSGTELTRLLSEVREGLSNTGPVHLSAGLAAPPLGEGIREMTNWSTDRRITVEGLKAVGFDEVTLLNDLEAAAHGLTAYLENPQPTSTLVPFGNVEVPESGNRALVIPGSGLGSAGIIDLGPQAETRWHIVPSEAGHTLASGHDEEELLKRLEDLGGGPPTWEDCCSGPGLEALWVATEPDHEDDPLSAPEIAMRAAQGDQRCQEALDHYYRFAARFAQFMALSFLSVGGLYLAGGTTRSNAPLISEAEFLRAFHENHRMASVLEDIPVFLVLAEINLLGAWEVGWRKILGPTPTSPAA